MWVLLGTLVALWLLHRLVTRFLDRVPRHTDMGPRYDKERRLSPAD